MNALKLKSWSERQQVLSVILLAGLIIFVLWFFLLTPLSRKRRSIEGTIEAKRTDLVQRNFLLREDVLEEMKGDELRYNKRLNEEWRTMVAHVSAFSNTIQASDLRIDFKVALFDVRQRLLRKSRSLGIALPHDLGMDAAVRSDEDTRKLMLQLRGVERLVDLALDLKIDVLRAIEPMPPILHETGVNKDSFMEEYPVRVECCGSMEDLNNLMVASLERETVFALRRLRVEASSPDKPEILNIQAVLSTLVFLKDPDQISVVVQTKKTGPVGPMGH